MPSTRASEFRTVPKAGLEVRIPNTVDELVRTLAARLRSSHSAIVTACIIASTGGDPDDFGLSHEARALRDLRRERRAG